MIPLKMKLVVVPCLLCLAGLGTAAPTAELASRQDRCEFATLSNRSNAVSARRSDLYAIWTESHLDL
jgi:hypothetical protein